MLLKRLFLIYIILIFLSSSVLTINVSSQNQNSFSTWDNNWSYYQEIKIPITTNSISAKYQPIDIYLNFKYSCWAEDKDKHSIRICCLHQNKWYELESQIYDLEHIDNEHITDCRIVYLIPEFADGTEKYYVYYDESEKPYPNYKDHINITDDFFYFEPISGISIEGDYYKISEDGYIVYVIGQKGHMMNRRFSQIVIKEKPKVKEFDLINSDIIASFSFSFYEGLKDEDEVSSDQKFISKKVKIDGNLMVECGIVSESTDGSLRTTNYYKYYYCPINNKRICVNSKHEILKNNEVKGLVNIDGRYGALLSYKSSSSRINSMRFGEILPYLHMNGEDGRIKLYNINQNPESEEREWVISYEDDCDLGKNAWISYDDGENGRAHAIIFSSNEGIVKKGTDEKDGIQLSLAEKEYLDVIGAEVDYASINFGRNSFEKKDNHDINIPDDLVVEYNAEFFTTEENSYHEVVNEGNYYRLLEKHRQKENDGSFEGDPDIYTLAVLTDFTGRLSTSEYIANLSKYNIPINWVELYKENEMISSGYTFSPLLGVPRIIFPKLTAGFYIIKCYRKFRDSKKYIGFETVNINDDKLIRIFCTWEKKININILNQNNQYVRNVELILLKNDSIVTKTITDGLGKITLNCPYNIIYPYTLQANYKDFCIYNKEIPILEKKVDISLNLYDFEFEIKDKLGFSPGVDVQPILSSQKMIKPSKIIPRLIGPGKYLFEDIPGADYNLQMSYGSFQDIKQINIPKFCDPFILEFLAEYNLKTEIYDSYGNPLINDKNTIDIIRNDKIIYKSINPSRNLKLPPGYYIINVYSNNKLIGSKNINFLNNRIVKIVTIEKSKIPLLIIGLILVFIIEIIILLFAKKISLNTFIKILAMSLILISIFQPWWTLNATSSEPYIEKTTEMFLVPQAMIETIIYNGNTYRDLATIPEMFTNFVGILLIVVCSGLVLLGISFIPNLILKKRYSKILILSGSIFLVLVAFAFSFGMAKICELSLGNLQGNGILDVVLPNGETVFINANWGLGIGFYLCIFSTFIILFGGIFDYYRKKTKDNNLKIRKYLKL